jgi:glucose/arabinose dehydrogenase
MSHHRPIPLPCPRSALSVLSAPAPRRHGFGTDGAAAAKAAAGRTGHATLTRTLGAAAAAVALLAVPLQAAAQLDIRLVAGNLAEPLFATAPLAGGPVFVVEKGGTIRHFGGGQGAGTLLSLSVATGGEQGLLGLAFDPTWGSGGANANRFFVNYIDPDNGDTVVASFRTLAGNPLVADPGSRVEVLRFDQPNGRDNHKAGWIGFKPGDANHLFIATGDGGGANDPDNHAQNRANLLGAMLRIDVNGSDQSDGLPNYDIPSSNPFVGQAGVRGEIFAYGLRNPFRNSFDAAGNLWIADVGQGAREEVNFVSTASGGGQNFGWRVREGDIATPGISDPPLTGATDPILVYDRSFGRSITGGYVVSDPGSPLFGRYVFGDFVTGRIFAVAADGQPKTMADAIELTAQLDAGQAGPIGNISSFGMGAGGELYIVDYGGKVVQVVPEPATALLMLLGGAALWARRRMQPAA